MNFLDIPKYKEFFAQYRTLSGIQNSQFKLTGFSYDQFQPLAEETAEGKILIKVWSSSMPKILWVYAALKDGRLVSFPVHWTHANDFCKKFQNAVLLSEFKAKFHKSENGKYWCSEVEIKHKEVAEEEPDWSFEGASSREYIIKGKQYVKGYFGQLYCPDDVVQRQQDLLDYTYDYFDKLNSGYYLPDPVSNPKPSINDVFLEPFIENVRHINQLAAESKKRIKEEGSTVPNGTATTVLEYIVNEQKELARKWIHEEIKRSDAEEKEREASRQEFLKNHPDADSLL